MICKRTLWLMVFWCTAALSVFAQESKDIAVVVHPSNPVTNISLKDLRQLYLGDRLFWSSKIPVLVILHKSGTPETDVLLRSVVKMSDSEFSKHWDAKVFRGEASAAPPVVFSNGMAGEAVSSITGAISLIAFKDVKGKGKIVKVDGLQPGQPGYPLHQ